jgi:hypothetical protein
MGQVGFGWSKGDPEFQTIPNRNRGENWIGYGELYRKSKEPGEFRDILPGSGCFQYA